MRRGGQGEALAVWALLLLTLLAVRRGVFAGRRCGALRRAGRRSRPRAQPGSGAYQLAVCARRDRAGARGDGDLPRRAWWLAGPAIALCATMPLFVSQSHLNARWQNLVPGIGVALALGLGVAAIRRAGTSLQPRLPGDPVRLILAAVVLVLSLPWIAAELGFHLPGISSWGRALPNGGRAPRGGGAPRRAPRMAWLADATLRAFLSRVQAAGRLRISLLVGTAALAAYGAVNATQDFWQEQLVKRGTVDWAIPSALYPGLKPVTLVTCCLPGSLPGCYPASRRYYEHERCTADGVPRLRQVRACRPDLCARADRRRRPWQRPPHAGLGRGNARGDGGFPDAADDPRGDGCRGDRRRSKRSAGVVPTSRSSSPTAIERPGAARRQRPRRRAQPARLHVPARRRRRA